MPERDPIRSQGDLIIDVEAGDFGPYQYYSSRFGTPFQASKNGDFVVRTGGTERLRISNSGAASGVGAFSLGWLNVKDPIYGAKGDGVADDTAAIRAADAAQAASPGSLVFVPVGSYKTTIAPTTLTGPIRGQGQIIDSAGNKRGPWFSAISAAPSSVAFAAGSILTAFNGDLSKTQIAIEHRITGATTLGQPSSGYLTTPEASPVIGFLYNESGWNQSTSGGGTGASGRTGTALAFLRVTHVGLGDAGPLFLNTFVSGQKPGYTDFFANATGFLVTGQVTAGADGVYMEGIGDVNLVDQGHDVGGNGIVLNFFRTNSTGAAGSYWNGIRLMNQGSQPVDVAFMAMNNGTGSGYNVGLDLSNAGLPSSGTWINAAITLAANQRIYFNASGSDSGSVSGYRRPNSTGTTYLYYDSATSKIQFVVGNAPTMQMTASQVTSNVAFQVADGQAALIGNATTGNQIANSATNKLGFWGATPVVRPTGWAAWTGTLSRTTQVTTSATLAQVAETLGALINDLMSVGLIGT